MRRGCLERENAVLTDKKRILSRFSLFLMEKTGKWRGSELGNCNSREINRGNLFLRTFMEKLG